MARAVGGASEPRAPELEQPRLQLVGAHGFLREHGALAGRVEQLEGPSHLGAPVLGEGLGQLAALPAQLPRDELARLAEALALHEHGEVRLHRWVESTCALEPG